MGKDKIKPLLDEYCKKKDIESKSVSTIGRIISDLKKKGKILSGNKLSLSGKTGRLIVKKPRNKRKKHRRKGYQPQVSGDLEQLDTISKFINGVKRYIATSIDLKSDFAFA